MLVFSGIKFLALGGIDGMRFLESKEVRLSILRNVLLLVYIIINSMELLEVVVV